MIAPLIARELGLALRGGQAWLPFAFFLLVASLSAFAGRPDAGALWVAALLASLLPVDRLVEPDRASGVLDQLALRDLAEETIALAKIIGHWLGFGPLLMAAALPAAAMLGLSGETLLRLEIGLLVGTPGLAALGVAVAALTAGYRGAGALAGLILLPLAVPVLIFGAGQLEGGTGALGLLAAASLILVATAPFAAGAAIREGRQ